MPEQHLTQFVAERHNSLLSTLAEYDQRQIIEADSFSLDPQCFINANASVQQQKHERSGPAFDFAGWLERQNRFDIRAREQFQLMLGRSQELQRDGHPLMTFLSQPAQKTVHGADIHVAAARSQALLAQGHNPSRELLLCWNLLIGGERLAETREPLSVGPKCCTAPVSQVETGSQEAFRRLVHLCRSAVHFALLEQRPASIHALAVASKVQ